MFAAIAVAVVVIVLGWIYQALKPPPPKICGSPDGPPVTSPRVKLSDGRHLAYKEFGVPREKARYKIIIFHGFSSSKEIPSPIPQELVEELKICFLTFDRPGYGESDPYPSRSVKTEAFDIQELADKLQLGSKFYIMGLSMGAYAVWSCLKYIPHRLAGAAMVGPIVNYWWPCLPASLSKEMLKKLPISRQLSLRVAHHTPWLFYWWMTQKWFPSLSMANTPVPFCNQDLDILEKLAERFQIGQEKIKQQGEYESLYRDIIASYGKWEFDLTDITNPFPNNEGTVHIWQGDADLITPVEFARFLSQKLPWLHFHELPDHGHLLLFDPPNGESVIRALLQI